MSKEVGDIQQQCLTPPPNAAIIAALLDVEAKELKIARRVVQLQFVITILAAGLAYGMTGTQQMALAVLSGGGVSVINGAMLAWRMSRVALTSVQNAQHQLRVMYFYATERFLVVAALLALSLAVLNLSPLAVLSGFVMGQAVLLIARLFMIKL